MLERLTRFVLRNRWFVLVGWIAVFAAALIGSSKLNDLLTNQFLLPGTDTERAETVLRDHFGQRPGGAFTLVVRADGDAQAVLPAAEDAARRAAATLPTGAFVAAQVVSDDVITAQITSDLDPADAKLHTDEMRDAIGEVAGADTFLTGQAAIEHDLDPVFEEDLQKGELMIALPLALILLAFTFGTLAFLLPLVFALVAIPTTLGIIYLFAQQMTLTTYITNFVSLIGLGIAIDYSLLIVHRFREELRGGRSRHDAILRTMTTAGHAVIFSGVAVAIGLAVLLLMPLPFMRGFGLGGMVIPIVSVFAALTFLPVMLSLVGRPLERVRLLPQSFLDKRADHERGFWARLARSIMRRPVLYASLGSALLIALTLPVLALEVGPGSNFGLPKDLEAVQGLDVLTQAVGAGATAPTNLVIDTGAAGGASTPELTTALDRLRASVEADPQVSRVDFQPGNPQSVDATGRYLNVQIVGKTDYGTSSSLDFVDRLRDEIVPGSGFPEAAAIYAGGGPPGGADFLDLTYSTFPWLVLAVLVATYFLLVRAFRSVLLPLKAIILNLLSIGAAYGLTVVVFKWGAGEPFGLLSYPQIEGWIPVMVFAMLFGLSMDYEVFLVSQMREEWDNGASNEEAVVAGLVKTGRLVTSAGLIMFAAFMGFVAGSIIGLQQFGFALAAAILIDVTIVRAILVPAAMKLFGDWNWWLPPRLARVLRVPPSGFGEHKPAYRPAGR